MRVRTTSAFRLVAALGLLLAANIQPAVADGNASPPAAIDTSERFFGAVQSIYNPDRAAQAGVQWERLIFPWSLIQKTGPAAWGDGYFSDQQIAQEVARGIQVVGLATYTPQWATSTPQTPRPTNVPANLYLPFDDPKNYWGQFMYKLAQRYANQINIWVVWNEPDMYTDAIAYTWDGTIPDMYQLVKVAYQAIRKANPNAKVVLPGLTYWYDKDGGRPLYLARFMDVASHDPTAAQNGDYFDIVDIHQYTNPLNIYAAATVYQRAMAQFGVVDKPIWVGESNIVPDDDPMNIIGPAFHATMDQQAAYMIQAFALARAAGIERMSIYKLVDETREGGNELYGLVRNDGTPRPAFNAYQTAVKYMSHPLSAVYTWDGASETPTEDQITQLLQSNAKRSQWIWPAAVNRVTLERGAERDIIVWNASPKLVTAQIPAAAKSAQVVDKFGRDTGEVVAQNGVYHLELAPTTNNTDPRDPSVYLVGGDPRILVEKVTPLPQAVDAPIQVVWARDANNANITGVLLNPGTLQPPPCRWDPTVRLYASANAGPTYLVSNGAKRILTQDGLTYPVWDFNSVDISAASGGRSIDFWMDVNGISTHATRWTYTTALPTPVPTPTPLATPTAGAANENPTPEVEPTPTPVPFWQQQPTASCAP
jgi:hypothetical protein